MFTTLFFTMSLAWQSHGTALSPGACEMIQNMYEEQAHEEALDRAFGQQSDAAKQRQFESRFNNVAKALADFGETWNQSHKIDERKEERLRKAWRDLGKVDRWFNTSSNSK